MFTHLNILYTLKYYTEIFLLFSVNVTCHIHRESQIFQPGPCFLEQFRRAFRPDNQRNVSGPFPLTAIGL